MSKEQHQNPQEGFQADETLQEMDAALLQGERFVEKYLKQILGAAAVVVVLVLGYFGYQKFVKEPSIVKAAEESFVAEDRFITGQDSLALHGEGLTVKGFEAIIKEHSGTPSANLAHAYAGIALYDQGKYTEALEELRKFSSDDQLVGPSIERLIGDCYAQLDKLEDAAKAYISAAKNASNDAISPNCLVKAGRVYEKLGQGKKAIELYEQVKKEYYTSQEAANIEVEIQRASALK